jgi:hypothetical protein
MMFIDQMSSNSGLAITKVTERDARGIITWRAVMSEAS